MSDEKLPLTLHSGSGLVQIGPLGGRILAEMVNGALVLSRATGSSAALMRRFRIGEHELCEPDYQQILLWAKALDLEPETVIESLLADAKFVSKQGSATQIVNGRIIKLCWDIELLPLVSVAWVKGLVIETIDCSYCRLTELDLSAVPLLTSLSCGDNQLTELELSAVPLLTLLYCGDNQLTELDLSTVPILAKLVCHTNQLTELDLWAVPLLTELYCFTNELTELDLSDVPLLTVLYCSSNQLTELELSAVPLLTKLDCS
jgi:Leucine-rich repeat (LRR) protein